MSSFTSQSQPLEIEAESNNYKTRNIRIRTGTLIGRPAERDETSRYPFISSP